MSAKALQFGKEGVNLTQGRLFHCFSRALDWGGVLFIPAKRNSSGVSVCGLATQRHRGVEQPAGMMGMFTQATESFTEGETTCLQALAVELEAWKAPRDAKK